MLNKKKSFTYEWNFKTETSLTFIAVAPALKHEKLFRKDNLYDYLIVINYNIGKIKKNKGSAIFVHLTKNYKPTAGCVALKKKDFIILAKLINNKTKIKIF